MHIMYFTERPYHPVPEDEIIGLSSFFGIPNKHFDPAQAAQLYHRYLDEKLYAEEMGFDGVMLNEHHGTPFCLGAVMDVEAAILARITKRVKIVLLGNPLPTVGNPLRLAEELAEIDMISGGRLVSGWVRGAGSEQFANNANPAYNRELFNEAHELIIQAWTRPGPFRFEGKHFHYRFVNPWALPLQKPHPQIWIPGLVSPETIVWCAKRRYPYIALATFLAPTVEIWNMYAAAAAEEGYQAGPENFGYLQKVFVAETEARAQELGKAYLFGGGMSNFARHEWMFPPGYNSKEATRRLAHQLSDPSATDGQSAVPFLSKDVVDVAAARRAIYDSYQPAQDALQIIVGTPKTVIKKLRKVLEVLRPGIFGIWHNEGPIGHDDTMTSIRLLGQEVLPAMREMGKELALTDPFERKVGTRPLPASGQPEPVAQAALLASL
jgi:alkanesulfonate monooxygenase SsuD/methylene tetrahydromethanopterin reductase-like flavin-dependent oxidoreductase (luciferase family)